METAIRLGREYKAVEEAVCSEAVSICVQELRLKEAAAMAAERQRKVLRFNVVIT